MESNKEKEAGASADTSATLHTDKPDQDDDAPQQQSGMVNYLQNVLAQLKLFDQGSGQEDEEKPKPEQLLSDLSLQGVAEYMQTEKCKNVIVMCGAGISTAAGIPDFRSPGSGLYHNLQKYNLPSPQAIFEISFFKENPEPFFALAKELYPGVFKPTLGHYFLKLLDEKGLLLRAYSQNIDTLERIAGLEDDKIVEAHGTFHTAHCLLCGEEYSQDWMRDKIFKDELPRCTKQDCDKGLVKPDIVFFGEALPMKFHKRRLEDFSKCDLLIVMGTSLKVQPFASLVDNVPETTPRLLINREKAGSGEDPLLMMMMGFGGGLRFDDEDNYRDVFWEGNCDDGCRALCSLLGWLKELDDKVETEHKKIDEEAKSKK